MMAILYKKVIFKKGVDYSIRVNLFRIITYFTYSYPLCSLIPFINFGQIFESEFFHFLCSLNPIQFFTKFFCKN